MLEKTGCFFFTQVLTPVGISFEYVNEPQAVSITLWQKKSTIRGRKKDN